MNHEQTICYMVIKILNDPFLYLLRLRKNKARDVAERTISAHKVLDKGAVVPEAEENYSEADADDMLFKTMVFKSVSDALKTLPRVLPKPCDEATLRKTYDVVDFPDAWIACIDKPEANGAAV